MPDKQSQRWRSNVWLRAGLFHPTGFVAPWVALAWLLSEVPGSDGSGISWGLAAVLTGAVASFATTLVMAIRAPLARSQRELVALLGLVASVVALGLGLVGWLRIAVIACHGRYECPF